MGRFDKHTLTQAYEILCAEQRDWTALAKRLENLPGQRAAALRKAHSCACAAKELSDVIDKMPAIDFEEPEVHVAAAGLDR